MAIEATIQLGGIPEFPASDQAGNIFVNIDDKSEITEIDAKTLKIKAHWPLSPCQSPSGALNQIASSVAVRVSLMQTTDPACSETID
jgi:hypothetical protein